MRPLLVLRNYPVAIASVLVLAFTAWLVYEATRVPNPTLAPLELTRTLPFKVPPPQDSSRVSSRPGLVTADLIDQLQPGMARVEVEELIGTPPAALVHPVANVNGHLTYRASYLANLEKRLLPLRPGSNSPPARSMIGVEYDASRPGHPLVKVHIPDPMS